MSYKKFTKDVALIGATQIIIALKGLIILPVITKLLGAEIYGIWTQILVTISLIIPIATIGLPFTLVRFLPAEKDREQIREGIYSALSVVFAIAAIVAVGIFLLSNHISIFFGGKQIIVQILAFLIVFECLNAVLLNIFRAFQKNGRYSFFALLQSFGEVALIVASILSGYKLLGVIISLLIIRLALFLIMGIIIVKEVGFKIPNFTKMKSYLSFGLPTIGTNVAAWATESSNRYLLGSFLGVLFVGYYATAFAISSSLTLFTASFSFILPTVLAKLFDENNIGEVKKYLKYSLKFLLAISIPAFFGISVLSKTLLTIFSTAEIAEQSYLLVPFFASSVLFMTFYAIISQILFLKKKMKTMGMIWTIAAFLSIGLNLILIPAFGIIGAATATLIVYIFIPALTWYYANREFQFEIDWISIFKSILASVVMSLSIIAFNPIGLSKTLIAITIGAIFYFLLLFLFRGFNKEEISFFKKLIKGSNLL